MRLAELAATALNTEQALQRAYYEKSASSYDDLHVKCEPEHNVALRYIAALAGSLDLRRLLDVGCGTGRGVAELRRLYPDLQVLGVEPVSALLREGVAKGIPPSALVAGDGYALPFEDAAFDAVIALGVLHHVARPEVVVKEMLRVARKGVFISDGNLFGQGPIPVRILKFLLYKAGLWNLVKRVQTRGRGYTITEGDGLAYSYSAFFQYEMLAAWANRIFVIPTSNRGDWRSAIQPLVHRCVLLCAIRD